MTIGDITVSAAIAWIIAAAGALVAVSKAIDILKMLFGKSKKELGERIRAAEEHLDNDNRRIAKLETAIASQQDAQAVMFRGLLSIINHELTGNGDEVLRNSRDEINNYLTHR